MLKTMGLVCLLLGSTLTGLMVASGWEKLLKDLRALRTALQSLASLIEYQRMPLPDIMAFLGRGMLGDLGEFFFLWGEFIASFRRPGLAFKKAREKLGTKLNFPLDLWNILEDLANSLGISPSQDQIKHIQMAEARLERLEFSLEKEVPKKAKLWRYVGVLGGLALAIVCF